MNNLFEKLEPPDGGAERLRRKLDAVENQRPGNGHRHARLAVAAIAASFLLVIGYSFFHIKPPFAQDYGIFQRYMEAPSANAVSLVGAESSRLRLVQQRSDNPMISLYWIEEVED